MNVIPAPHRPNLQALKTRRFWTAPTILTVATSHKLLAPHLAAAIGNLTPPTHPLVDIAVSWLSHGLNLDAPFVTVDALALFQWSSHYRWADITKEVIMLGLFKTAKREMLEQVRAESHQQGRQEGREELIQELKADPEKARQILNGQHEEPTDRNCPDRNAGPSVPPRSTPMPQTGNRAYGLAGVERKQTRRLLRRVNKGLPSRKRRQAVKDQRMAQRLAAAQNANRPPFALQPRREDYES